MFQEKLHYVSVLHNYLVKKARKNAIMDSQENNEYIKSI
jgi:hypothetical protein